jgi:hypothetical protein
LLRALSACCDEWALWLSVLLLLLLLLMWGTILLVIADIQGEFNTE